MDIAKIADIIKNNDNFAIAIHVNPDGDCLGSSSALVSALRNMGKTARIVLDGTVPERLEFVTHPDYFGNPDDSYDVCIAVDVASDYMMGDIYKRVFEKSNITCCIDHHGTNGGYADYNHVDADASAAGEIVYEFIRDYLGCDITAEIASMLYTAIASDTGGFRYSNTTPRTHIIASELICRGVDSAEITRKLFEEKTISQLRLRADAINGMQFYADSKICVVTVDRAMLSKYNMTFEQADDLASLPGSVRGVEVGVYVKVRSDNEVKMSLRSKRYVDVSRIAATFGGGGHLHAAGVTMHMNVKEAEERIISEIVKAM